MASEPSTVQRAWDLMTGIDVIYGIVSGVMLAFAFGWSSQTAKYDRLRSFLAVGAALGALGFSLVIIALMGGIAIQSLTNDGDVEPKLVLFFMLFLVVVVLAGTSLVALVKAGRHLIEVMS